MTRRSWDLGLPLPLFVHVCKVKSVSGATPMIFDGKSVNFELSLTTANHELTFSDIDLSLLLYGLYLIDKTKS